MTEETQLTVQTLKLVGEASIRLRGARDVSRLIDFYLSGKDRKAVLLRTSESHGVVLSLIDGVLAVHPVCNRAGSETHVYTLGKLKEQCVYMGYSVDDRLPEIEAVPDTSEWAVTDLMFGVPEPVAQIDGVPIVSLDRVEDLVVFSPEPLSRMGEDEKLKCTVFERADDEQFVLWWESPLKHTALSGVCSRLHELLT